ncbi:Lar family restriction alleviation protein [Burkholderia gladioli]|uniref:Lar family restriction alleviation protein n=1 Tax=Burkholderia gladioli TaxID=28095 RepID=UPI003D23F397
MSDKLSELLPCPFCGCTKVPKRQGNGIGDYWLECFDCGASTRLREDGAGMEKDWNRRPSPAPAISESDPRLERSIEQWRKCDPDLMSRQSQAAIFYALKDAKHDILALDAARKGEKS